MLEVQISLEIVFLLYLGFGREYIRRITHTIEIQVGVRDLEQEIWTLRVADVEFRQGKFRFPVVRRRVHQMAIVGA